MAKNKEKVFGEVKSREGGSGEDRSGVRSECYGRWHRRKHSDSVCREAIFRRLPGALFEDIRRDTWSLIIAPPASPLQCFASAFVWGIVIVPILSAPVFLSVVISFFRPFGGIERPMEACD